MGTSSGSAEVGNSLVDRVLGLDQDEPVLVDFNCLDGGRGAVGLHHALVEVMVQHPLTIERELGLFAQHGQELELIQTPRALELHESSRLQPLDLLDGNEVFGRNDIGHGILL